MTSRFIPLRAAALLAVLLPFQSSVRADTDFGQVAIYVAHMLENTHISHKVFDNELSAKVLDSYLDFLDARHQIFTQQDVDGFRASYKDTLDDSVMLRDISPAVKIYEVYKQRVKERVDFARKTLEKPEVFTFDSDRSVDLKREKLPWPKDQAAADGLWRDLIEAEMLSEIMSDEAKATDKAKKAKKAADKPKAKDGETVKKAEDPEEPPAKRVLKDYERLIKNIADNKDEEVVNFFLSCLAMSYDPHTEYFSVSEMDSFNTSMRHELIGIGAMLKVDDDVAKIQGLVVGGPADKSGLLALDDKIIAVGQDGEAWVDTKYLQLNKIVDMIRGKEGSTVHLRIVPADDPSTTREINIVRAKVSLKDNVATADLLETPGAKGESMRVGWISLASFYADMEGGGVSCTADVERLLRRLIKENINGLVLDLRGNGGGSLEEAIRMTGLFVPAGPVVQVKDWKDDIQFK